MKPVLYSYYRSSCSYRVRIALAFLEIEYDLKPVHLVKEGGEQLKDDYLELNPMGQVPYFKDEKVGISQSMAILEYLADTTSKKIRGNSAEEASKIREFCEVINSGIQPLQNLSVLKSLVKDHQFTDKQKLSWIQSTIIKGFKSLEFLVDKNHTNFCFGQFSLADALLIPQIYNAQRFEVNMDEFPKLKSINEHCLGLSYFKTAHPDHQADCPE